MLGVFHSHPDCAAIPSSADTVAAFPYFSYLIVSVYDLHIAEVRSWQLSEERLFIEETISIQHPEHNHKNILADGNYHHTNTLT